MKKLISIIFIVFLSVGIFPAKGLAHATLVQSNPAAESQLNKFPHEIVLTFNERLERELFELQVYDRNGKAVAKQKPKMSTDQRVLSLKLPKQPKGVYTVTYRIISADGHPVSDSYVFTVGKTNESGKGSSAKEANHQHDILGSPVIWGFRAAYFFIMLLAAGFVYWGTVLSSEKRSSLFRVWEKRLLKLNGYTLIIFIVLSAFDLLSGEEMDKVGRLLLKTTVGLSWIFSFILAFAGIAIIGRKKWLNIVWIVLTFFVKSLNGHAAGADRVYLSIPLDMIHLFAASIWAGGLFYLFLVHRKDKEQMRMFLPVFSKTAFISLVALMISGLLYTLILQPKLSYLVETSWGILLLIKIVAVLVVLIAGAMIRRKITVNESISTWLKADFSLLVAIIIIVGALTYMSPTPVNEPLTWVKDSNSGQIKTEISPMKPGNNSFSVEVVTKKGKPKPIAVELWLYSLDSDKMAPIKVSLKKQGSPKADKNQHEDTYARSGPYLPFPGKWLVEVKVLDQDDNEHVCKKEIRIFDIQ